jgi:hypothetical protein
MTSPDPTDGVAGEIVNDTSPYDLTTVETDPNSIVRTIDPGAFVLGGASTIGGAGGATVEVEDSFVAIVVAGVVVVAVGAAPRVGSTNPGFLPLFDFLPLPETRLVVASSPRDVDVIDPPSATVISTLADGELLRLASNTTGVDSAKSEAAPIASACAPENFVRNHRKAPLRRSLSSTSTSKSSFMSSITVV